MLALSPEPLIFSFVVEKCKNWNSEDLHFARGSARVRNLVSGIKERTQMQCRSRAGAEERIRTGQGLRNW